MKALIDQLKLTERQLGTITGQECFASSKKQITSVSPVDSQIVGVVTQTSETDYHRVVALSKKAALYWRNIPAPQRGQVIRSLAKVLREHKAALGALVSYEMGKSFQEGQGEVQEMIDICDFAVGLSRQLHGRGRGGHQPRRPPGLVHHRPLPQRDVHEQRGRHVRRHQRVFRDQ